MNKKKKKKEREEIITWNENFSDTKCYMSCRGISKKKKKEAPIYGEFPNKSWMHPFVSHQWV